MSWSNLPEPEYVQELLDSRARLRASIRVHELELRMLEAEMSKLAPRNTAARVVGVNDETRERLYVANYALLNSKADLDRVEAQLEFFDYQKEIYKANSFRGRV